MKAPYIVLVSLGLLAAADALAQVRNTTWLHGLGGNAGAWQFYEELFTAERLTVGIRPNYPSLIGIANAANVVAPQVLAAPQNIGVGHSLGGLVARQIDRTQTGPNRRFGGIITVGTPHQGARMVNALQAGEVEAVLTDACARLTAGPLSELGFPGFVVNSYTPQMFCQVIRNSIIVPQVGPGAYDQPTHNDLASGSAFLEGVPGQQEGLNATMPNVPMINIWGNEQSPVHWRLASSTDDDNANDQRFVQMANTFRSLYQVRRFMHLSMGLIRLPISVFNPRRAVPSGISLWRASRYKLGIDWLDQSESIYLSLIDCSRRVTQAITIPSVCANAPNPHAWLACMDECYINQQQCEEVTQIVTIGTVNDPSDGLICRFSAVQTGTPPENIYEALGVNHAELVNTTAGTTLNGNDEMRRIFNEVWDRPQEDFFRTLFR